MAKKKVETKLTSSHKIARLAFAKKYMSLKNEWQNVLFTDEKKFNLDDPDGWQYYWHDLRKTTEISLSRNFGGETVMVWGRFSFHGSVPLAWITTKMNSDKYVGMLKISLIEYAEPLLGKNCIFQQDNASIHSSNKGLVEAKSLYCYGLAIM